MSATHRLPRTLLVAVTAVIALLGASVAAPTADAAPPWAPAADATVTPGVQMVTEGGQCTANFVFTAGSDVLLGYAAHCAGTGEATATNGCEAATLPTGTEVEIQGASQPGTLAYSSWETMQERGDAGADACRYNDFALVELHPDDHGVVNPSLPHFGGPEGIAGESSLLDTVHTYGNSSLRLGIELLSPKIGLSLGQSGGGWNHTVYTVTPGIPGDSGSAVVDGDGRALGILSTLALAPAAGSNGVTDLARALDYARGPGGMGDLELVEGDVAVSAGL